MKELALASVLMATTGVAVSSDGLILSLGLGSTETTTTVNYSSSLISGSSTVDERGGTGELSLAYRLNSNYQFGITGGSIAVEGDENTIGYTIITADYIFMKDRKIRPFIGFAYGHSRMEYITSGFSISSTAPASGFRLGVGYESGNWTFGYKYQRLSTDLKGSDTTYIGFTEVEFEAGHKDFTSRMFFMNYHF
ncbi:MAG: hypothetical protein L3J62_00300 [Gammaproteobacteria bacterium]|nr:hypothetical protein [Gammaproteobacteria bacterium]MCF6229221.1 hypothetical protein [Gammaproteobacteria bacterium]